MEHLKVERDGPVLVVEMCRGKANALNGELVDELSQVLGEVTAEESVRGLVLGSDRPRFFSTGFDVREVFQYDRQCMSSFLWRFTDLYESLYRCPKPVVAALSGHTFAGGAILALACDFRVMAEGDAAFAINEIDLGVSLAAGMKRMLVDAVGVGRAREILLTGNPLGPARALEIGLVQQLAPAAEVLDRALMLARTLAEKPATAFRETKRMLREAASQGDVIGDRTTLDKFLDMWFSAEAVERRRGLAERLG